jgi:hypothetical protein
MLCAIYPSAWRLAASGFADANLNATWTLNDQGNCNWADSTATVSLALSIMAATLTLKGQTSGPITYTAPFGTWNCCQPNSLTLATNNQAPGMLTATPLNCSCAASFCGTCAQCNQTGFPQAFTTLNVSGFMD